MAKYCKPLPLSHYTFINHAVKQEKTMSNFTNAKQKEIYNETIDHVKVTETYMLLKYFRIKRTATNSFT